MNIGIVKWFNPTLGYGFIAVAPSVKLQHGIPAESDLYFHINQVVMKFPKQVVPDQKVSFTIGRGEKGACATGVKVIDAAIRTQNPTLTAEVTA